LKIEPLPALLGDVLEFVGKQVATPGRLGLVFVGPEEDVVLSRERMSF
jgi:hypothetical protein